MHTGISVVVPAHNEEKFIRDCFASIQTAARNVPVPVETVVVLNRCSDRTEDIAREFSAVRIHDDSRRLGRIRNRGVQATLYDTIVTCDADSRLHPMSLRNVMLKLAGPDVIGGGMALVFDRRSTGIWFTERLLDVGTFITGLSCGAFWTRKEAFHSIGGFNEQLAMGEDVDFAQRLRQLGRQRGQRYERLRDTPLLTSARKFNHFGDWHYFGKVLREPLRIARSIRGTDTEFVDEYFYNFNDRK